MKDTISFTIPLIPSVLLATARTLTELASDLAPTSLTNKEIIEGVPTLKVPEGGEAQPLKGAAEVFKHPEVGPEGPTPAPPVEAKPAPAPAPIGDVDLDIEGLPWDARIHASTKTKVASGAWKKKRGLEAAEVAKVEEELINNPDASSSTPQASPIISFGSLMSEITAKKIDLVGVSAVIGAVSEGEISSLAMLATRPDLIPLVASALDLR